MALVLWTGPGADGAPCREEEEEKYPREIPLPPGLPEGWKCFEYKFKTGMSAGKSYFRFTSPEGKPGFLSGTAVLKHHCETHGEDLEAALKVWEQIKFEAQDKRLKEFQQRMVESKKQKAEEAKAKNKESLLRSLSGQGKSTALETGTSSSALVLAADDIQTPPRQLPGPNSSEAQPSAQKRRAAVKHPRDPGPMGLLFAVQKKRRENSSPNAAESDPPEQEHAQSSTRREALQRELEKVIASKQAAVKSEKFEVALQMKCQEDALQQQLQELGQAPEGAKEQLVAQKTAPRAARADSKEPQKAAASAERSCASSAQLPPVSLGEFFQFLQCQLCMEAQEVLDQKVPLKDPGAKSFWDEYKAFVTPNLGKTERWVPYHTMFGVHELFLIQSVHHREPAVWSEKQRFLTMFIFRAHCKRDFFNSAQLPFLLKEDFWKNPLEMFRNEGPLESAMLDYRRRTKQPLLTLCFRMIPERVLKDDDENLVRSIVLRTQTLLTIAEEIWPILKNENFGPGQKFSKISGIVQGATGLGETWAKMLMVCIDLAYPEERLLESQCEVGVGALPPLRALLPSGGAADATKALKELTTSMNKAAGDSADHFWALLPHVEELARKKYNGMRLIEQQACTERGKLNNVTVQVQLCEYRQFRNFLARTRYSLAVDESMKFPDKKKMATVHHELDEERQCLKFELSVGDAEESLSYEVALAATQGNRQLAERIGWLVQHRFCPPGASLPGMAEVLAFRDELYQQCKRLGREDAAEDSEAWRLCKVSLRHPSPLCSFVYIDKSGTKIHFQTTVKAAGGNMLEAERIARLCWAKLEAGATREEVLSFRTKLYEQHAAGVSVPGNNQSTLLPVSKKLKFSK
mmetsp:Transcript_115539/g.204186  ORF Transcript_115539/g.204186 Transcript_115539/m.204186 type:complete len:862 (+) Transcript_115539:61-2646(+)